MGRLPRNVYVWGADGIVHLHKALGPGEKRAGAGDYVEAACGARIPFPPAGVSATETPTCDDCLTLSGVTPRMFDRGGAV